MIKDLEERGVSFKSLDIPECENPLFLEFFRTFILFFARWEQSMRRERQMAGILRAKAEKKYKGRKSKIDEKLLDDINERLNVRNYKKVDIYKSLGISRTTIYKALKSLKEREKKKELKKKIKVKTESVNKNEKVEFSPASFRLDNLDFVGRKCD
jgi:DNA invertase Pin-like site-specific DNA recombinase